MRITKQTVADEIAAYLHHEITLAQLVDWSERALLEGEFAEREAQTLSSVIARLGVAGVGGCRVTVASRATHTSGQAG